MKKWFAAIGASILVILAFLTAGAAPMEKSSAAPSSNSSYDAHLNFPHSEIEHCSIHGTTALKGQQGVQKLPGNLSVSTKSPAIPSSLISPVAFATVELFDNNYLSHNYPSHNFW